MVRRKDEHKMGRLFNHVQLNAAELEDLGCCFGINVILEKSKRSKLCDFLKDIVSLGINFST